MALLRRCSPLLIPLVLLAGCANNDNSDREQQIRQDAEQQGRQEEKLKQLENEVKEQRKNGGTTSSSGGTTTPAPNNTSSKSGNCGGGIYAGSNTTCDFARNVASEYGKQSGPGVVSAFSPATGKTISMSCEGASPVVCTGGNNARVELR
jgi:hypothetical protein